ncbi:MAG: hypothetical protein LBG89_04220, partial [Rickettsiales bacterium]|nr:hypothetical protein [Rickettsiales bacterium]
MCVCTSAYAASNIPGPGPTMIGQGGNLTSYKGGYVAANQYNNLINPNRTAAVEAAQCARFDECAKNIDKAALAEGRVIAKEMNGAAMPKCTETLQACFMQAGVSYNNCQALLRRCAVPKCAKGCAEQELVLNIVAGCQSSLQPAMALGCQQYATLSNALAAEIVSMGVAAQKKAAAEASAQAAAAAQSNSQAEAMQQQMAMMQQQMAAQAAESAAQQQRMMDEMMAAQRAAEVPDNRKEILARDQASGQIMSEIDRMNGALDALKKSMTTAFDYAGCDYKGENCGEVRRVAAFREKANKYFDPFEEVVARVEDVVFMGEALGADLSNVYLLF